MERNPQLDQVWENKKWAEFQALVKKKNNDKIDKTLSERSEKKCNYYGEYLTNINLDNLSAYNNIINDSSNLGFDFKSQSNVILEENSSELGNNNTKQTFRKTSICKYWELGLCNKVDCNFAHGAEELHSTGDIYKTTLCKYYKLGTCTRGDSCRHAHGEKDLRVQPKSDTKSLIREKVTQNISPEPLVPKTKITQNLARIPYIEDNNDKNQLYSEDEHACEIIRTFLKSNSCTSKKKCLKCHLLIMLLNEFFSIDTNCDGTKSCDCQSQRSQFEDNTHKKCLPKEIQEQHIHSKRGHLIPCQLHKDDSQSPLNSSPTLTALNHNTSNNYYTGKSECTTTDSNSSKYPRNFDVQSTLYSGESSENHSEDGSQFEMPNSNSLSFFNNNYEDFNLSEISDYLHYQKNVNQILDTPLPYIDLIANYRNTRPVS